MTQALAVHPERSLLRLTLDADTAGALVLRDGSTGAEVRVQARRDDGAAGVVAVVDTRFLLRARVWEARYATGPGAGTAVTASPNARPTTAVVNDEGGVHRVRARTSASGLLALHVEPVPPHAEIERVVVEDDALLVDASLVCGPDDAAAPASLVARSRDRGREITVPALLAADRAHARLPLTALTDDESLAGDESWDLYLRAGDRTFRLARLLDDVPDKKRAVAFPARTIGIRTVQPFYTVNNALSLRCTPATPPVPGGPPPGAARQADRPLRALQRQALHLTRALAVRVARLLVHHLPARRQVPAVSNGRPHVSILVLHGYGMGGTIRTVFNLAGYLARDYDVEIVSQIRRRVDPFFPLPRGVAITAVDDHTPAGERTGVARLGQRLLSRLPSLLVHEADSSFAPCTLWTDVQLVTRFRAQQGGILITTRPALNLLAAQLSAPGVITVGQEHMNYEQHRGVLARDLHRTYGSLDALTVLTDADLRDYAATLAGSRTRVVRIPNLLTPLTGGRADPSSTCIVAAGRLTSQKGFDLLLAAFARVVDRHPEWTLRIHGSGPEAASLRRMIGELGLYDNVFLMGRADRIGDELAKGSVFVLSSRFEGFGMVVIEAMSKGLAVVSFDCPRGPGEIITDGEDGILVPAQDVERLGDALLSVVRDERLRSRLGAAAVQTSRRYAPDAVGPQWDQLLTRLLTDRAAVSRSPLGTGPGGGC